MVPANPHHPCELSPWHAGTDNLQEIPVKARLRIQEHGTSTISGASLCLPRRNSPLLAQSGRAAIQHSRFQIQKQSSRNNNVSRISATARRCLNRTWHGRPARALEFLHSWEHGRPAPAHEFLHSWERGRPAPALEFLHSWEHGRPAPALEFLHSWERGRPAPAHGRDARATKPWRRSKKSQTSATERQQATAA